MEAKFTKEPKGPWLIEKVPDCNAYNVGPAYGGHVVFMNTVCTTYGDTDGYNAHLIAAAPEMYEALDDVVKQITSADIHGIDIEPIIELLAKARGEHE